MKGRCRALLIAAVVGATLGLVACSPDSAVDLLPEPTQEATETVDASYPDPWDLWNGYASLRGANVWQRRVIPEIDGTEFLGPGPVGPPYTQSDFDTLALQGANYVNISYPGLFTEREPYEPDAEVIRHLDSLLDMIGRAGMWAVISFRTGPGRTEFTFNRDEIGDWFGPEHLDESVWEDRAAQDAWVEMWRFTAERYRYRNPNVLIGYDLMVEPNANETVAEEWDPHTFYDEYEMTLADWNYLHPRIAAAIREVDPMTPILVQGMSYGSVEWLPYLELPDVPRVVVAVHQYAPTRYTHQQDPDGATYPSTMDVDWDGSPDRFDAEWLDQLLLTVEDYAVMHGSPPVVINEFGLARWQPGAAQYLDDQMTAFELRGWSHAYWQWMPEHPPLAQIDQFDLTRGPDYDNHAAQADNELLQVLRAHWGEEGLPRP